ncbi:MAG: potassium transporter Kup [Alphaproteobacteria bacterium]|nr:potassium transporter Kup [Alphaproteobacteria bacterium]
MSSTEPSANGKPGAQLATLIVGAVGVVYGDIGTSPLYTLRQAFAGVGADGVDEPFVLGVLSLVIWALIIIVTLKYVLLVLRADNKGEGGVLSLAVLALRSATHYPRSRIIIVVLSVLGLSLFGGDGLITPAISVLSAVEGLTVVTPALESWVVPVALGILIALFVLQSRGTHAVGRLFGPIMGLWFVVIGGLGLVEIVAAPHVLLAIDPTYAIAFFATHGWQGFGVLSSVLLAVTGAEALYADMGHFGRAPIRAAWLGLVLPGLLFNYLGQGALVLGDPSAASHPFFLLAPDWALMPLVLLATAATVIASQAVISGAFSLTRQAVQLGYIPRMTVLHTSETEAGQVYMPWVNWLMMGGVVALVVIFRSSDALAAAYGVSVIGAMAIDTILVGMVARWLWGWSRLLAVLVFGAFLLIDVCLLTAALLKIPQGAWIPLLIAGFGCVVIGTWRRGRRALYRRIYEGMMSTEVFLATLRETMVRVPGTAVFMTANTAVVPNALLHNLKHNKVLHERVVLMTVQTLDVPRVPPDQRLEVERLGKGFHSVVARFGFMESPNVPGVLELCRRHGLPVDVSDASFFLGRESLIPSAHPDLPRWQERLFIMLSSFAVGATAYFRIPPGRVVELGTQIEI